MRVWRGKLFLVILLVLIAASLTSGTVFASSEVSISISSNSMAMNVAPGMFGSESQTITASTTNTAGYTIGIRTTGTSSALVHTQDSSYTVPTFTLPSGVDSIPVGSLGYGYGYSTDNGTNYSSLPEPSAVQAKTLFTTSTAGSNTHTLTFGAKVPMNAAPGTYVNTFTIEIVANFEPCAVDSICYDGNGDDGTGTMDDQSATSNSSVDLIPSNFSRPGYGFVGWSDKSDWVIGSNDVSGNGTGENAGYHIYGPGQTITVGDLSTEGLQLYAIWVLSGGSFQTWDGCEAMNKGDVIALTDARDDSAYAVAKYEDGKCWMMENLRLDLSNSNVEINELTTNKPTTDFATAANAHPASSNSFCTGNTSGCISSLYYNTNNINRGLTPAYDTNDSGSSWYSYGVYYNYYTATAGNGGHDLSTNGTTVKGDICPKGWKLPSGFTRNDELAKLDLAYGGTGTTQNTEPGGAATSERWRSYPLNYIYSGEQNGENGYNRGISAGMNTINNSTAVRAVNLWVRDVGVSLVNNTTSKARGQTVRCIKKQSSNIVGNIHYNSNGGTGTMADQEDINFSTARAANNQFTRAYYEFVSWNTKANGSGITVSEGSALDDVAVQLELSDGDTLTLYAIWRPYYRVVYDGNGADAGSMVGVTHEHITSSFSLWASNYSRDGYGFAGWSADANAGTKILNHQDVTVYGPNQNIKLVNDFTSNADATNQITLYAVWLEADTTDTMQTFGSTRCGLMNEGELLALTDERDGNVYTVAKLADGNCWITENLRLDPSTTTFTTANTNNPTANFISEAPLSQTATTLCNDDNSACIDNVMFNANNLNRSMTASPSTNNNASSWYSYGMMYGWYAATAGNGNFEMASGNVAGDICPAGWRLPTGGSSGEFVSLVSSLAGANAGETNNNMLAFPNNFIYSGDYNYNTSGGRSTYGRYWSATPESKVKAFRLGVASSGATPAGSWNKWDAFAVRCIVK